MGLVLIKKTFVVCLFFFMTTFGKTITIDQRDPFVVFMIVGLAQCVQQLQNSNDRKGRGVPSKKKKRVDGRV